MGWGEHGDVSAWLQLRESRTVRPATTAEPPVAEPGTAEPGIAEPPTPEPGTAELPTPEPPMVLRCGLLDTLLADLSVSVVHFFEDALDEERLAAGLAVALAHVPVFAGRLRTAGDALEIVCDGSGVPMDSYDVAETLRDLMGRVTTPGAPLVDHVEATKARSGELPLLTVRISRTSDHGTALGVSWHHAVGDVQSFVLLMRAWSAAVEGQRLPEVELV
ncbi:MAG: hypothetical protein QOF98_3834, partial [Streptomyces sp.]|nr:hypothetical protein [Streptomyces sp.]